MMAEALKLGSARQKDINDFPSTAVMCRRVSSASLSTSAERARNMLPMS